MAGVSSFNTRTGAVVLLAADITALQIPTINSAAGTTFQAPGDGQEWIFLRSDSTNNRFKIRPSDGGSGTRLTAIQNSGSNGTLRVDAAQLSLYNAGTTVPSIRPIDSTYVLDATDGTNQGWFRSPGGEVSLAADFTRADTTLTATNLSVTLIAGRSYRINGILEISNSTAAEGAKFDLNGGTATATKFFLAAIAIGNVVAGTTIAGSLAGAINYTTVTGTAYVSVDGFIKVNAAGTVKLRASENTTATGTMTLGLGSWLNFMDIRAL